MARKPRTPLAAGATAPDFKLSDYSTGSAVTLSRTLERGPVLVAIYKIGCPTCQLALPFLDRLHHGGSLQVFGISQDNQSGTARFHANFKLSMPSLLDREEDGYVVSNAFGISSVPSLFMIEPDGRISMAVTGFVKGELESIGRRAGVEIFRAGENVPEWKAG
jgi:peroxiredoxin